MEFKKLVLNNFMSYAAQEFSFEERALVLVEGENLDEGDSNGSGKSSVWDALSWALFGQTVRGLKGDEVIRRGVGTGCSVMVLFDHGGKSYLVRRFRKDVAFGDRFMVEVKGEPTVELGTLALTQAWLLDRLQIDFELFRCTVLFAQGETFNFVDSGNKAQKDILSKVMQVDFSASLDAVREKVKYFREQLEENNRDLLVLQSHVIDDVEGAFEEDVALWATAREVKIEKAKKECVSFRAMIQKVEFVEAVEEYRDLESSIEEIEKKLKPYETEYIAQTGLRNAVWAEMREIAKYEATILRDCPTCFQPMNGAAMKRAYESLKEKADEYNVRAEVADAHIHRLRSALDIAQGMLNALEEKADEVNAIIRGNETAKTSLRAAMDRLKEAQAEENPFKGRIEAERAKQEKIARKITQIKSTLTKIDGILPYYLFWQNAFGNEGIKSFVFDLICSALTAKANSYLNVLTNGFVSVSFDTQRKLKSGEIREKFDCIVSVGTESVPYAAFSGGEKRRISLAVDMALSDLMTDFRGSGFSIVVLDEQDVHLDNSGRKAYMKLLKQLSKSRGVFVVAHDDEFKSHFDNVWKIRKRGGVSALA